METFETQKSGDPVKQLANNNLSPNSKSSPKKAQLEDPRLQLIQAFEDAEKIALQRYVQARKTKHKKKRPW